MLMWIQKYLLGPVGGILAAAGGVLLLWWIAIQKGRAAMRKEMERRDQAKAKETDDAVDNALARDDDRDVDDRLRDQGRLRD